MADSYIDNNSGSKKKYLIPLVVLMICAVSLTGAGYAYSNNTASLEVDDLPVDAASLSLDLTDGSTDSITTVAGDIVNFYDHFTYSKANSTKTNYVSFAPATSEKEATYEVVASIKTTVSVSDDGTDSDGEQMTPSYLYAALKVDTTDVGKVLDKTLDFTKVITGLKVELKSGDSVVATATGFTMTSDGSSYINFLDGTDAAYELTAGSDYTVVLKANVACSAFTDDFGKAAAALVVAEFEDITMDLTLVVSEVTSANFAAA